jgi:hypothetical protein
MKRFKQIDIAIQVVAIVGSIIYGLVDRSTNFIFGYFVVGGLQIISFLVHWALNGNNGFTPGRRRYGWFLLVLAILALLCWVIPEVLIILLYLLLLPMLFVAPVIAIAYCNMCYNELKCINHENEQ